MVKNILLGIGFFIILIIGGGLYNFLIGNKQEKLAEVKIGDAKFEVEVADSVLKKARGLSNRGGLPENKGMLFVFDISGQYPFWMKGMNFPLDIIWIKGDKIIGIEKNIPPPAAGEILKSYQPAESIDKVLEINAGSSDELGIKVGDKVIFK